MKLGCSKWISCPEIRWPNSRRPHPPSASCRSGKPDPATRGAALPCLAWSLVHSDCQGRQHRREDQDEPEPRPDTTHDTASGRALRWRVGRQVAADTVGNTSRSAVAGKGSDYRAAVADVGEGRPSLVLTSRPFSPSTSETKDSERLAIATRRTSTRSSPRTCTDVVAVR